jgi:hypothetical protein
MKNLKNLIAAMAVSGLMLYSCSPENVRPSEGNDSPSLAGAEGDEHPALDTICSYSDTLFLMREDNQSLIVDKCWGRNPGCPPFGPCFLPQVQVPCTSAMSWGHLLMVEGSYAGNVYMDCEFQLAPNWFCDFNNWHFSIATAFIFDQNGVPIVATDWGAQMFNPVLNKWKIRLPMNTLPSPCFDVALRVSALKLTLQATPLTGSPTVLWGHNRNWNNSNSSAASTSPFLLHFCPTNCQSQVPPPVDSSCVTVYTGISNLPNCTTISADGSSLSGSLTYEWGNGATTPSISVCPGVGSTTYWVTISSNGSPALVNAITVNNVNAACGNGNGNNGIHKVWVCHVPPGNPSNVQDICIDWSGVPAHVARFRTPAMNPNHGHDSGCEIGRCGSNPCL